MNKVSLLAALILFAAAAAREASAQVTTPSLVHITNPSLQVAGTKLGLLNISLNTTFQAYQKGSAANNWGLKINPPVPQFPNRFWSITTYDYLANCLGTVLYSSAPRQINNPTIIDAINVALSTQANAEPGILMNPGSPYVGKFGRTTAKLVVVNYDNQSQYAAYPPTEDNFYSDAPSPIWNAPWIVVNNPLTGDLIDIDGQQLRLNFPNQNWIAWGKPNPAAEIFSWIGTRVFILDPRNANPNLRCFDITPFFAFEESFCKFCWDTMDRVTDGKIVRNGQLAIDAPCAGIGLALCGVSGNGTTKFYWTVKFSNVRENSNLSPNYLLWRYYQTYLGYDPAWGTSFGSALDDANVQNSPNALVFTLSGLATYHWGFKILSDGLKWTFGNVSMTAQGKGYAPLCGVFKGSVSVSETDSDSSQYGGAWCLSGN